MNIKKFGYVLVFIAIAVPVAAQDIPAASKGDIQFYLDWSSFRGTEEKSIQSFSLMTFSDQFTRTSDTISIKINALIRDNRNRIVYNEDWITYAILRNDSLHQQMSITDEFRKDLAPGPYKAELKLTDPVTSKSGRAELNIIVPDLTSAASSMIKFVTSDAGSGKVNANPSRRYGILNPVLSIYYEIYTADRNAGDYKVSYSISDDNNNTVKKLPSAIIKNTKSAVAVTHGLDVSNVPSGIYNLNAVVKNDAGREITTLTRAFEIIQIDYASLKPVISEEQAEESGRLIKVLSPSQYTVYENLNLRAKAEYLVKFWKDLDPTPETSENEYLSRILQRYQYANKNFNWGNEQGWESDRGRVLIQYGNPDEVDAHHAEPGTAPYEIWHYIKDRNYMFVFADMQSNGHFVLVHSNKEGEIRNTYWKNALQK